MISKPNQAVACWMVTKRIQYKENDAFITITADDELQLPEFLDESFLVSINDLNSLGELEESQR